MRTLVVGCDASGKSTFLEGVHQAWGDTYGESTSSDEAREFRRANNERVIDAEYIGLRESLYLGLSHQALLAMKHQDGHVVTSDSSLVTRVSHSVMRQIISEPHANNEEIIAKWQADEAKANIDTAGVIVHTHAPFPVIRERIIARQESGDKLEHFWGFNAPFFLEAYQNRWKTVIRDLAERSYICLDVNTYTTSSEDSLEKYANARTKVLSATL